MLKTRSGTDYRPSLLAVEGLVRPHLAYDELADSYRCIRSIGRIIGTHGASIYSVVRLARDGRFSGGSQDPGLQDLFFMTPNYRYSDWNNTGIKERDRRLILERKIDSIKEAIEYSGTSEADHAHHEVPSDDIRDGAIITFNRRVVHPEMELHEDIVTYGALELTVPKAPALETIEGIYPVNQFAAKSLYKVLDELR